MKATVSTVMTRELVTARPTTPYKELVGLLRVHQINALPVVEADGRLVGIVSDADLVLKAERRPSDPIRFLARLRPGWRAAEAKAGGRTAAEVMSKPVTTATPDTSISAAARLLRRRGIRHLPVVDRAGRLAGIVTRRDLLAVFQRQDQELRHQIERAILVATLDLAPGQVTVEVHDGVVTLHGQLPWQSLGHELVELISALDGVVTVDDQLTYTFVHATDGPRPATTA
jgi:CBS domain-containing protein